jgi:hypothetical protein
MSRINKNNIIIYICFFGLVLRVFFVLVGAKFYFGRENIFVDGDTDAWATCIENLIEHGSYTMNMNSEYGFFGRMPGMSFLMGFFYLITGKNWDLAYPIIGWFQTLLDVFTIAIVFSIAKRLFKSLRAASITAFIYACYPFVIVWTPVVYSEYISFFLLFSSLYFLIHPERRFNYGWAGALIGLAALFRPQLILLFVLFGLFILYQYRKNIKLAFTNALLFSLMILCTFGLWPARNYINYHKIVLTQDLRGFPTWNKDVVAYLQYIYSVKAEWEPQFSQIIKNETVIMPHESYISKEDSMMLTRAIYLSQTCGSGFSSWRGYWKDQITSNDCNDSIAYLFNTLRTRVIEHDPIRFYITIPLLNLKKAIFKLTLTDTSTFVKKAASVLFVYRTLMLLLGLWGCILMIRRKVYTEMGWLILSFFIVLYIMLCAGTGVQFRNIEMRYFVHPDLMLLFPASYIIYLFINKYLPKSLSDS